jgi:glycerol-3-phosphate dehydrogenase (NAD(P)+)
MTQAEIGVIGAGAFGTALAVAQAAAGRRVALWARDPAAVAAMARRAKTSRGCPAWPCPRR